MLIAVGSVKGSPGATTFALALTAQWPSGGPRVLAELDPAGGDLAARFALSLSPGLVSLAAATRAGTPLESSIELLLRHTQELPGGLRVLVAPPGADQARATLTALTSRTPERYEMTHVPGADDPSAVVVIDVGRLDPESPSLALLAAADHVLLLARASADDLAHIATRIDTITAWTDRLGLLLVGDGYTDADVTAEVGLPVLARVPTDRAGAAILTGHGSVRPRPFIRATLSRAAAQTAAILASACERPERLSRGSIRARERVTVDPSAGDTTAADAIASADRHKSIGVAL